MKRPIIDGSLFDDGSGGVVMQLDGKYWDMKVDFSQERVPDMYWSLLDSDDVYPWQEDEE